MEPTTLSAIAAMEKQGLVRRERNVADRRKINVFLTEKGRTLEAELLPSAIEVVQMATRPLSLPEQEAFLGMLRRMQFVLRADLGDEQ
jgi:DNA-binding MarR family transcriptional regulator